MVAKSNRGVLQHYRKNPHINLISKRCCQRVPVSLLEEEIPQATVEEGIAFSSFFSMFFLFSPLLMFRGDHCHADKCFMSEIYVSKEPELKLQVISDSNSRISLFLELLKLTTVCQILLLVKEICSRPKRCKCIHKQDKVTDTKTSQYTTNEK